MTGPEHLLRDKLIESTSSEQFGSVDLEMLLAEYHSSIDLLIHEARLRLPALVSLDRFREIRATALIDMCQSIQAGYGDKEFPDFIHDTLPLELTFDLVGLLSRREYHQLVDEMMSELPNLEQDYMATLYDRIYESHQSPNLPGKKCLTIDQVVDMATVSRWQGLRVVTTYGAFDFHGDHTKVLRESREVAAHGVVIALLSSDQELEASDRRGAERIDQRLEKVLESGSVDFVAEAPWGLISENALPSSTLYRQLSIDIGAHFRVIDEVDQRTPIFLENAYAAGMTLIYGSPVRRGIHSSQLRHKL